MQTCISTVMSNMCACAYLWACEAEGLAAWQQLAVEQLHHRTVLRPLQESAFVSLSKAAERGIEVPR